jgi:hypothetical protein
MRRCNSHGQGVCLTQSPDQTIDLPMGEVDQPERVSEISHQ